MVYGWEISQLPKVYLEARFHAVWQPPTGEIVCLTPDESGHVEILFLRDGTRAYTGKEIPSKRFALSRDTASVEKYWTLMDRLNEISQSLCLAGIRKEHPAYQVRIGSLLSEAKTLRESIQSAACLKV